MHLNKRKCGHLPCWLQSAEESYLANRGVPAAREFCAAVEQAKRLVEECSHDEWLLKAVELWECTEHFVEVLLDLCWSAYIMSLGVGNIEWSEKWMSDVEELLNSRSERNDVAKLLYEDYHEIDKIDLDAMVCAKLRERDLVPHGPEDQLALLLQDRLKQQTLWRPPFLERHSFFIYCNFVVPSQGSCRTGAHGVILKLPWVYEKEFAVKMRKPKEKSDTTFKKEFDILDKYRSPFIVGVVGYWEVDSWSSWNPFTNKVCRCPFLVMENLECDLKGLMDGCKSAWKGKRGGFSALETIKLMLPIAKALRFLHGKDVAHRDVKPQNIMCRNVIVPKVPEETIVKEDTIVKLIDFGEARENVSCLSCDEMGPAGTTGYMDPMLRESDRVGYTLFMGDVFSFAIVFAELLTWRSPFEALGVSTLGDVRAKLKAGERPPLPNVLPEYVRFIVESCWCADHLKRPDFRAICSMLQHAKMLLLDMEFVDELDDIFSYEDALGGWCCISDET